MKKLLFGCTSILLLAGACQSKKQAVAADPNEKQLNALKTMLPEATMQDLQKGHDLYYGVCTRCHAAKDVSGLDDQRLYNSIMKMSAKAHLNEADKEAVWRYSLALNLAAKKH